MTRRRPCPCGSGDAYPACCRPVHRGEVDPTPARLVRARFAAFALGDDAFLFATLHPRHPDRQVPGIRTQLRTARQRRRYRRVTIHAAPDPVGGRAQVLFTAHLYEGGRARPFTELSDFAPGENGRWAYLDGLLRPGEGPTTIEAFLASFED